MTRNYEFNRKKHLFKKLLDLYINKNKLNRLVI